MADESVAPAEAFRAADGAVAAEESLERLYRLEPEPVTGREHAQAGRELPRALTSTAARDWIVSCRVSATPIRVSSRCALSSARAM
ncbi:hypothetical protein [Paractinoplanes ferrugineus]|nr:hypothetical protein [Actinoplanes ferrugineus]